MNVLLLSRYGELGASSRLRLFQYLPHLRALGFSFDVAPLFSDEYLRSYYKTGRKHLLLALGGYLRRVLDCSRLGRHDLVWLEKELFPWLPAPFEHAPFKGGVPYVVDYDDAIHHNYDQSRSPLVRGLLGSKLRRLVSGASTTVVGNAYLANWARGQGARQVQTLPTVVDLERYPVVERDGRRGPEFRVGWIGSPATSKYLWLVRDALSRMAKGMQIRLVLIGAGPVEGYGVPLERHDWAEGAEAQILSTLDVGIMPLQDSPWERGKCGYKLIQYMASGLPIVSSNVGANGEIVEHGSNGFLAETPEDWEKALRTLRDDAGLARRMGMSGRSKVEREYCLQVTAARMAGLLSDAAARARPGR